MITPERGLHGQRYETDLSGAIVLSFGGDIRWVRWWMVRHPEDRSVWIMHKPAHIGTEEPCKLLRMDDFGFLFEVPESSLIEEPDLYLASTLIDEDVDLHTSAWRELSCH